MVGDSKKDVIAGNSMGLKTILLQTGYFDFMDDADFVEEDLEKAIERILGNK